MKKLAIVTTHPIQYNAPLFEMLSQRGHIKIKVFYTWGESVLKSKYDPGFKKNITWDIPLLNGYDYQFVKNTSKNPGSHHFKGIINPTLIKDIETWNADAILVYGWKFKSHFKVIRYFKNKIPVYFRGDSTLIDENINSFKFLIKKILLKYVYKNIDKCFYVGTENKKYFQAFGISHNQLIFAPHAIDNKRFNIDNESNLRNQYKIDNNEFVILFAGKLENKKNPTLLLDAFIELNIKNSILMLVGNGELEKTLKIKCLNIDNDLKNRILFIDFQNQKTMPLIYKTADVFVLPSQGPGETWGLAINEAMASGLPVIVSDKCGCTIDLIEDQINGILFKSNDLNSLKMSLKYISENKERAKSMGKQANDSIQKWSFENICEAIESVIYK